MTDEKYLQVVKEILHTEAKICSGNKFPIGSTPKDAGASIENLNEIDIAFGKKGTKIKAFYDKLTLSNNSSPFYLNIKNEELDMWYRAAKAFSSEPTSSSIADMIKQKKGKGSW